LLERLFSRGGATAEAEAAGDLIEQIDRLAAENRDSRDLDRDREIMRLRQLAGTALARETNGRRELIEADYDGLPDSPLPEVGGEDVTAELIRAAILRHGAILVRGFVDPEGATRVAEGIDRAFAARDALKVGDPATPGYYEELQPIPPNEPIVERSYVEEGGGVLAADSPKVAYEMAELFDQVNLRELIGDYLQERPAFSAHKTTLRKADPSVSGAWHQDGKFLGDVNSVNLWVALSHCGDTAPGMDLVPRRLEEIVDAGIGEEGFAKIVVSQEKAEELAGDTGILRPIFEPGDAMFFDHLYLHQTASEPSMPNPRFAVESWFFGPSAFPEGYIPLAY
jgi:Phytanoyl-CoA dioxygenase (PhyH)